jgi:hypothetical protein
MRDGDDMRIDGNRKNSSTHVGLRLAPDNAGLLRRRQFRLVGSQLAEKCSNVPA